MAPIYLIEGPVGAGKSTHARKLATQVQGVHLALDEWFARLFSPDRPASDFVAWYLDHKARLLDLMWLHGLALARTGVSPILELGLIQRQARIEFMERAIEAGAALKVQLLDAPTEVRWERVAHRNETRGETFSMVVPRHIFDLASSMWERPDDAEIEDYSIEVLS